MQPSPTLTGILFLGLTALTAATILTSPSQAFGIRCAPGNVACQTWRDQVMTESPFVSERHETSRTTTTWTYTAPAIPRSCNIFDRACALARVSPY